MRWSKIKNIIILLLAVVNLCLLVITFSQTWMAKQGDRELREQMVTVLEQNGIEYLPRTIPGAMPLTGTRVAQVLPDKATAAVLVGEISQTQTAWARTTYTGTLGSVTFSDNGTVEASFAPGTWPLGEEDVQAPEKWGQAILEGLGVSVKPGPAQKRDGETVLTYTQLWNGAEVPDAAVELVYREDEGLTGLSGRLLLGVAENVPERETISAATALARFLEGLKQGGYGCSQVVEMYPGYDLEGTTTVTLTPTWYLTTDVWPWRFGVNAYTGAMTAEE